MADKPALLTDAAGTLSFTVPETGTITPATVTLYKPGGDVLHASQNASISGSTLSVALDTTDTADEGKNFRARWSYTISTVAYVKDQVFDIVAHVTFNTLTVTKLANYYPDLTDKLWTGVSNFQNQVDLAWNDDVLPSIRAKGLDPHLIMDAQQLEPVTAAYAIARVIDGLKASNPEWRQTAAEWRAMAVTELDRVMSAVSWYDSSDDLAAQEDETAKPMASIRLTR